MTTTTTTTTTTQQQHVVGDHCGTHTGREEDIEEPLAVGEATEGSEEEEYLASDGEEFGGDAKSFSSAGEYLSSGRFERLRTGDAFSRTIL